MKYTIKSILVCIAMIASFQTVKGQYASHSALSQGDWWKIAIQSEGIYRISPAEVPEMEGRSVADARMMGCTGGPLNELNGSARIDDLQEMAIEVHDNDGNGIFGSDDYILFYATGVDRIEYSESYGRYIHVPHPYSANNYVYLTFSNGNHQRVARRDISSYEGTPITECHSFIVHDTDIVNTHRTGQIWVGEHLRGNNTHYTITINVPGIPTEKIKLRYALATLTQLPSSFTVSINGESRTNSFSATRTYYSFLEEFESNGNSTIPIEVTYNANESSAIGYIDYIEADITTTMTASDKQILFRIPDIEEGVRQHVIAGASGATRIWEVSDAGTVYELSLERSGNRATFNDSTNKRRIYVAFTDSKAKTPLSVTAITNQDIHGSANPDMVIVSHSSLKTEAQRLADIHSIYDNMAVLVVSQDEVFNEFSSGQSDPIAIREMMRMFYKRWQADNSQAKPRYLLLLGKGTYDNKDILKKGLPTVVTPQTSISFDNEGTSIASDDAFTFLDDGEYGRTIESLDLAVGRIPAKNSAEATHIIDKIELYITRSDLTLSDIRGDWRNCIALLADDADPSSANDTVFTQSQEITAQQIEAKYQQYRFDKIYADAYIQQSGADGSYYPDANNALKKRMDYGCLLLNYIGHGAAQYIGTERFMMKSDIAAYTNHSQLPYFVTSTCSFGRYDDPDETCGAEEFLLADGAGVACLSASRPIAHIQVVNTDIVLESLDPHNAIGDGVRIAKNKRATTPALVLMGDPALRLSFPMHKVVVTKINGATVDSLHADTAQVLSVVDIEGEIIDTEGNLVEDFDGTLYAEVYDRATNTRTLANDNEGCEVAFTQQNSILYRGRTTVSGGRFSYHFTVPRDVAYKYERAKLFHYAKSGIEDATGAYTNLYLGGFDESIDITETRPEIRLFIGDTNFRNGGLADENPTLLALLFDSIGINAVGSGLGHDITAIVDGNPNSIIILNDFYETDIYDEKRGSIRYNLKGLTPGRHTIELKAWNIYNFSNSATITFYVRRSDTIATSFHACPNPADNRLSLYMEHNLKGKIASAEIEIMDVRGGHVRAIEAPTATDGYTIGPVEWNLCSDGGSRVPSGIYIARFLVSTTEGEKITEHGKIIVK